MAVIRQSNILGQQRIDVPHIRALESGVAGDFDLLAGRMLAGGLPLVLTGFSLNSQGVTHVNDLQMKVAGSLLLHYRASESGSIFSVPNDRTDEPLRPTNSRVKGQFQPSQVNYVGIDLVRVVDETTADLTMFLNATTLLETPKEVPLARTLDYRIVISTIDFSSLPGVCPIAKIKTDGSNNIVSIQDARSLFFRLGSGGTVPNALHAFPWPAGRREADVLQNDDLFSGGDRAINSMKAWADAVMTRLWEVGGGEHWFSPTADRNVRMVHTGAPFIDNGEYFEWIEFPPTEFNLHWQGLKIIFDNSTGVVNTVTDVVTNEEGLTDLADGDCLFVDLDRTQNATLDAHKAALSTLGAGSPPGTRLVLAWRHGDQIFTRDQGYAVNSSFKLATIAAAGTVRLSASDLASAPFGVRVASIEDSGKRAVAAGLTRGNSDFVGGIGDLVIGGESQDRSVILKPGQSQDAVLAEGSQTFSTGGRSTLEVYNKASDLFPDNRITSFSSRNSGLNQRETAFVWEITGAMGWRLSTQTPTTPTPAQLAVNSTDPIRAKTFMKTNGLASPDTRDQFCVLWFDGSITVIAESPQY